MTDSQKNRFGRRIIRTGDPVSIFNEDAISRRDQPLTGCWKLLGHSDPGTPTGRREEKEQAATSILYGDLFVAYRIDPECWVSYSRRRDFYAHRTRYWPGPLSYTTVMRFIEREARGNIENKSSSPGQRGTQSGCVSRQLRRNASSMAASAWSFAHLRSLSCAT
jgi:hypothetical protein